MMLVFPKKSINQREAGNLQREEDLSSIISSHMHQPCGLVQEADSSDPACSFLNGNSAISFVVVVGGVVRRFQEEMEPPIYLASYK